MDLSFSEEQTMLGDTTRRLCEDLFPLTALRAVETTQPGYSPQLWAAMVELGLPGLQIAETHAGLGLGALETVAVYEQLGRSLALSPHFASSVQAAALLGLVANDAQCERWLPALARGETLMSVAAIEPGGDYRRAGVRLHAQPRGETVQLSGRKHFVPFADSVDAYIVLARAGSDVIAAVVAANAPGLTRVHQQNLAAEPYFTLSFDGVTVAADAVLNDGMDMWAQWQIAMYHSLIPLAAQAVGAAARVHEISVEYAKQRVAFGRPIGGFQAIAHYLAEVAVEIEGCRTLVHQAAWARDNAKPFHSLAAMAKLQACAMFRRAAAVAIQVHGGLGYTIEADPQLYFRRAKQWQSLNWDEAALEQRIADFALGPNPLEPNKDVADV